MMPDRPRIVLTEDDREQAALFSQVLSLAGYDVITTATADAALAALSLDPPMLLLADWDLPGMKGDALITTAKARYPALKTILFSNHANVNDACVACGADGCMQKTEGIVRLRELVRSVIA